MVGETGHVIGVDMTPELLTRAREAANRLGFSKVEFREGFIEDLHVEAASVGVIISDCVINLSPNIPQVISEMFRVLKPGSRIAISGVVTHGKIPRMLKQDTNLWSEWVLGALPTKEEEAELVAVGFEDVDI